MIEEVITAGISDRDMLSELIAEAFFDIPPTRWLIENETARRQVLPNYFRIFVEHGLDQGVVFTTPDWAGAAVWLPVGLEPPKPPDGYHERLAAVTKGWTSRFITFDAALHARYPAGRQHHHLALLAVRPERQGRGIGSALLEVHHRYLDAAGLPAYLEASSRDSRRLYLRHGYVDRKPVIQLPDGPRMLPMWREPGSTRADA